MDGWLAGWLVGNAVFSETARRIFLIFCMKLGDYKGSKVTQPDFWKKYLIWRYSRKRLQIIPKSDTLIFFSKTPLTIFLVFGLKLVLNMTFNLNEPIFQKNLQFGDIWPRNRQKIAQIEVFGHFLDFASVVFLDFAHNNRWAWYLVVFLQFAGPLNIFLLLIKSFVFERNQKSEAYSEPKTYNFMGKENSNYSPSISLSWSKDEKNLSNFDLPTQFSNNLCSISVYVSISK